MNELEDERMCPGDFHIPCLCFPLFFQQGHHTPWEALPDPRSGMGALSWACTKAVSALSGQATILLCSILGQTGGFMQQDCLDLVRCLFQLPLQCSSYNRNLINMCSIHDCMDKLIFVSTLSLQSTFRDKCPPYPDLFDS